MDNDKKDSWFDPRKLIKPRLQHSEIEAMAQDATFSLLEAILDAQNEHEMLRRGIEFLVERCSLAGASFIPFNELKAIAPPIFIGEIGDPKLFKLDTYIQLVDLRQECKRCVDLQADGQCVLLADGTKFQIRCLNMVINGKKEGIINLYWPRNRSLEDQHIHLIERVTAVLERGIARIGLRDLGKTQNEENPPKTLDVISVIERSVKPVCDQHQIDEVLGYFPDGFQNPNNKLIQIIASQHQSKSKDGYMEMMDALWKVIQNTSEMVFLENKNADSHWRQLLSIPISDKEERGLPPSGMIVVLTSKDNLAEKQNDVTFRVVFEQIGTVLLNYHNFEAAYDRSMSDERIRLSREIHDGIAQTLAFLLIQMKRMWRFYQQNESAKFAGVYDESYQIVSDTYGDLRDAIHDLRRTPETDLRETILELCNEFAEKTGIETQVDIQPIAGYSGSQFQLHMIRIFQEALSNIRKHSHANQVQILGATWNGSYRFRIMDDGVGFDANEQTYDRAHHFGLTSIHERARILGIKAEINSFPGQGTSLELRL